MKDEKVPLSSIAMGLQGLTFLGDPISTNIKQYLYNQLIKMEDKMYFNQAQAEAIDKSNVDDEAYMFAMVDKEHSGNISDATFNPLDIIKTYRSLQLNFYKIPNWLENEYRELEAKHTTTPVLPFNRQEKLINQKYNLMFPSDNKSVDLKFTTNSIIDGFRLDFNFESLKLNIELDGPSHRFDEILSLFVFILLYISLDFQPEHVLIDRETNTYE